MQVLLTIEHSHSAFHGIRLVLLYFEFEFHFNTSFLQKGLTKQELQLV